jgi:hypothetical protein
VTALEDWRTEKMRQDRGHTKAFDVREWEEAKRQAANERARRATKGGMRRERLLASASHQVQLHQMMNYIAASAQDK